MPDTTVPLDDLTQQIARHESELQQLRHEFEARQVRLAELGRQRDDLQAQLRRVQADIEAVTGGHASATPPPAAAPAKRPAPAAAAKPATRPTLSDALVEVAREANRPLTAKELGEQLVLRRFPTTSGNITGLVQNRLTDLVKRGVFHRIKGQPGVVLAAASEAKQAPAAKPARPGKAAPAKEAARKTAAPPAPKAHQKGAPAPTKPAMRKGQPSLRSLLADFLQKSSEPVPARVLAEQVLATGYKTKSKDFTDVVWTALGQMKEAENVKGQGWRFKKK